MKNFEERYTAWMDGTMEASETDAFEREIDDLEAARRDRADWSKLGGLMRECLVPEPMPHPDFVNSQVLDAIRRETPAPRERPALFPIRRLVFGGAFLVVLAAVATAFLLPRDFGGPEGAVYASQVISAQSPDPKLSAYAFQAPGGKGTVLWIENPGFIPAGQSLK